MLQHTVLLSQAQTLPNTIGTYAYYTTLVLLSVRVKLFYHDNKRVYIISVGCLLLCRGEH